MDISDYRDGTFMNIEDDIPLYEDDYRRCSYR